MLEAWPFSTSDPLRSRSFAPAIRASSRSRACARTRAASFSCQGLISSARGTARPSTRTETGSGDSAPRTCISTQRRTTPRATRSRSAEHNDFRWRREMIVGSLVLIALLQAPLPSWDAPAAVIHAVPQAVAESLTTIHALAGRLPADTPVVRRPLAIEYSDQYYTRLTIHRYGSYA